MMKQRNPEATCGTCVYAVHLICKRFPSYGGNYSQEMHPDDYCGEHPEFFLPEPLATERAPSPDYTVRAECQVKTSPDCHGAREVSPGGGATPDGWCYTEIYHGTCVEGKLTCPACAERDNR